MQLQSPNPDIAGIARDEPAGYGQRPWHSSEQNGLDGKTDTGSDVSPSGWEGSLQAYTGTGIDAKCNARAARLKAAMTARDKRRLLLNDTHLFIIADDILPRDPRTTFA